MKTIISAVLFLCASTGSSLLWAQTPPEPEGSRVVAPETPPTTTEPDPRTAVTPPSTAENTSAAPSTAPRKDKPWPSVMYGLGVNGMLDIFPFFMFDAFTLAHQSKMYSVIHGAGGIHFTRRKERMDMTVRVMFGYYGIKDGNYLGKGHDFSETDWTEFHNINFLWADISWTWYTKLAKQFYLGYGAGVGIGWVMGKVYTTPSSNCTANNYSNSTICKPDTWVCTESGCARGQPHPQRELEKDVPPVLPAINGHIGLRYDFFRHLSLKFDTGLFLPGFWYFQLSLTAFF